MPKKASYSRAEASLRDYVATHLHLIEKGMELVRTEHPLHSARGAKGFIDILARDIFGHRVVIEIKRSNSTARHALHELHKYVELLQENHGLTNAEVRCIIISTEWPELAVPFGQYQRTAKYPVEGFTVTAAGGRVTGLKKIGATDAPSPIRPFRLHTGHFFADEKSCTSGLPCVEKGLAKAGVTSAVILLMRPKLENLEIIYPYCLYVMIFDVSGECRQKYLQNAKRGDLFDPDDNNEIEEMFEQEVLCAADSVMFTRNRKYTHESSWPEKFAAMVQSWKIVKITRIGRMQDENLFTDDDLRRHLLGYSGAGEVAYHGIVSPTYAAAWQSAKEQVRRCLVGSKAWQRTVEHAFRLIEGAPGDTTASFHIYNLCDTVMMLFKLVGRNDPRFVPEIETRWRSDASPDRHVILGTVMWDGKAKPRKADGILNRIFHGDGQADRSLGQADPRLIDADDDFKHLDRLLRSVPGVGPTVSATLLAELGELGQADRRQIGALVGVAPFNADSGGVSARRSIRGGRGTVRSVVYMGALTAMRANPVIKAFAERLKAAGKQTKVILTACMRKLLALINAMVRDNLTWDQLSVVKKLAVNH